MKGTKNSNEYEPTLLDVLQAVQTGFERHDRMFKTLHEGQQNLREIFNERTNAIDKCISKVQNRVEDVVDVLEKAAKKMPSFDLTPLLYENK